MSPGKQIALVRSVAGDVNLALRVKGTTAACLGWTQNGQGDDPGVVSVITDIASSWSTAVDESDLPPTLNPNDPDQCNERMDAATGDGTNASLIAQGMADCVAIGF